MNHNNSSRFSGRSYSPAYDNSRNYDHSNISTSSHHYHHGRDTSMMSQEDLTQALVHTDDVGALLAKVQLDHQKRLRWMVSDATGGFNSNRSRSGGGLQAPPPPGPYEKTSSRSLSVPLYPPSSINDNTNDVSVVGEDYFSRVGAAATSHSSYHHHHGGNGRLRSPALADDEADVVAASYVTGTVQDVTVHSLIQKDEERSALASHLVTTADETNLLNTTSNPHHNNTSRSVSLVSPPSEDEAEDVSAAACGNPTEVLAALVGVKPGSDDATKQAPAKQKIPERLAAPKQTPVKKNYAKATMASVGHGNSAKKQTAKKSSPAAGNRKSVGSRNPQDQSVNTSTQSRGFERGPTSTALRERHKNRKNWNELKNTPITPQYGGGGADGGSPSRSRILDESGISVYESFFTRQPLGFRYDDEQGGTGEDDEEEVDPSTTTVMEGEEIDETKAPSGLESARTSPKQTTTTQSSIVEVRPSSDGLVAARGVALAPDAYEPSSVFPVATEETLSLPQQGGMNNNSNYNRVADVPPTTSDKKNSVETADNPLGNDVALAPPGGIDTPRSENQGAVTPGIGPQDATPPPAALIHHHRQGTGIDVEAADAFLNDTRTLPQEGDFFFEGSPGLIPNNSIAFQDPQPLSNNTSRRTSAQTAEPFVLPATDRTGDPALQRSSTPTQLAQPASKHDTGSASEGTAGTGGQATSKPKKTPALKKPLMAPKPSPKTSSIRSKSANDIDKTGPGSTGLGSKKGPGGNKKQLQTPPSTTKTKKGKEATANRSSPVANKTGNAPVSFATPSSYAGSSDEEDSEGSTTESTSSGEYTYDYVSTDGESSRGFSSDEDETEMTQTYRSSGNRGVRARQQQQQIVQHPSSMKKQQRQGTYPGLTKKASFAPGVVFSHQDDADEFVQAEALLPTPSGHAAARGNVVVPPANRPGLVNQQGSAVMRSGGYGPVPNQQQRTNALNQSMNSSRSVTPSSGVFKGSSFGGAGPSWRLGSPEKMRSASPTGVASGVFTQRSGVFQPPLQQSSKEPAVLRRQTSLGGNVFPGQQALLQQQRQQAMRQQQQLERQQMVLMQQQQQRAMMANGMDPRQAAAMKERQMHEERLRRARLAQQQQQTQMQQQQQQIMKLAMMQRQQQSMSQPNFSSANSRPQLPPPAPAAAQQQTRSQPNFSSSAEPQSPQSPSNFRRPILSQKHERQLSNSGMNTPPSTTLLQPVPVGGGYQTTGGGSSSHNSSQTSVVVHPVTQNQSHRQNRPMIIRPTVDDPSQGPPPLPLQQPGGPHGGAEIHNPAARASPAPPPPSHHQHKQGGTAMHQGGGQAAGSRGAFPVDQVVQPTSNVAGGGFTMEGGKGPTKVGSTSVGAVPVALVPPPKK